MQNILKIDSHAATTSMITLIREGNRATRLKIFRFLATKLKQMESGTLAPEAEINLLIECKKLLKEFSSEEFTLLLEVLKYTRIGKSVSGQQTLADLAIDFSEAIASKDSDVTALEDAIASLKFALPFFCSAVRSSRMLKFVIHNLLPRLQDISDAHKADLLKTLAVLTAHSGEIDEPQMLLESLYHVFLKIVPPFNPEIVEQNISFDYSSCEAVLFVLHKVGGKYPAFFGDQGRLSEFRLRLQYLSRNAVAYIKTLNDDIKKLKPDDPHLDEKRRALKVLPNIQAIVIDFMRSPPSFSKTILLSFETEKEPQNELVKRKHEIVETEATSAKREREGKGKGFYKQPYSVPGGKFSSRSDRQGFRGRFSGRGRY
uniref:Apoptosis inhibitor protein 5 n=1 Tax=Artemia sinica TaxID=112780 RepID=F6MFB0_9CRUS|nr:apoptosis inhibitor protein 5 [Artemia sinica]